MGAGMHYDPYVFTVEESRFYNTTKPYSELGYLLGSHSEQMINLVHTQNITRNWNAFFQYRLINSPGTFGNQNTKHNNYRFTSWYQSNNKRYQAFLLLLGSKLKSAESAGIQNNAYLDSIGFSNRFNIPTNIGNPNILQCDQQSFWRRFLCYNRNFLYHGNFHAATTI